MRVWVKEFEAECTVNSVAILLKKEIEIRRFTTIDIINISDIIIISKEDFSVTAIDFSFFKVLFYEEVTQRIFSNVIQQYEEDKDYYYLKDQLDYARTSSIDTIITGSSYGLYGIDASLLSHKVNLSLPSQDLYYSLKGVYKLYKEKEKENVSICNVVLCCGYYYFHTDLSRTKNQSEISRIAKVYHPIYHDMHNCVFLSPNQDTLMQSNIFDFEKILHIYRDEERQKGYFSKENLRKCSAMKEWQDSSKSWDQLSESEKRIAGQRRTALHNKNIKRNASFYENACILKRFATFCSQNKIHLLVGVTPASKYYLEYLDQDYKNKFFQVLNEIESTIHLLDLSSDSTFQEDDFIDTDHLNEKGAKKMTQIILTTLQQINEN